MKKKNRICIYSLIVMGIILILITGCKKDKSSSMHTPVITWAKPAAIHYGVNLSQTQLNASADVPGTFVYTPEINTKLDLGYNQDLKVVFTPTDAIHYETISKTVQIDVIIAIGDSYKGGKVAYIFVRGDPGMVSEEIHGLIAAPTDLSTTEGIQWFNGTNTITGATATALGTGSDNTKTIVDNQGNGNYAANACSNLVIGGFDDWFLPSRDELKKLYLNNIAIGGFVKKYYWTSSETDKLTVRIIDFNDGSEPSTDKVNTERVRAIRYF